MPESYYTHTTSTVVDAPITAVWTVVRDVIKVVQIVVGSAAQNLMWLSGCSVEQVPAGFTFNLPDGPQIHEEVTGRSEADHTIQYRAHGEVLTMAEYRGEIRLHPVTLPAGKTFVTYSRTFRLTASAGPSDLAGLLGIMDNEMVALQNYFSPSSAS